MKLPRRILAIGAALLVVLQLVPYGREHSNPPVTGEPAWDGPRTRELAARACFDCHSNLTHWPWYSHVAPASWLLQRDVDEGRSKLNFTEWDKPQREAHEAGEIVGEGEMPPWFYTPLHWSSRLRDGERDELARGMLATIGGERKHRSRDEHGAED